MSDGILEMITQDQLISQSVGNLVERYCERFKVTPFTALLETHIFNEEKLADLLSQKLKLDRVFFIVPEPVPLEIASWFSFKQAKEWECFLQIRETSILEIITSDPTQKHHIQWIKSNWPHDLQVSVGERTLIHRSIDELYPVQSAIPSFQASLVSA